MVVFFGEAGSACLVAGVGALNPARLAVADLATADRPDEPAPQDRPTFTSTTDTSMKRQLKTGDDIQAEVWRLIHADAVVLSDGEQVHVPRPISQAPGLETEGCNWTMRSFGNASAYRPIVAQAMAAVQAKWNLNA